MRILLLAFAGCWTGSVEPTPPVPHVARARPQLVPSGYFVPNLVAHRLETNAFDELGGERAVLNSDVLTQASPVAAAPLIRRPLVVVVGAPASGMPRSWVNGPAIRAGSFVVQYCIDISGRVTSAHVETHFDDQVPQKLAFPPSDREALDKMRGWRFAPYFVAGKPVTACSFIDYTAIP